MKKMLAGFAVALLSLGTGCDKYDDSELRKDVGDLKGRIEKLEKEVQKMNGDIASLNTIVTALEKNVYVAKVEETTDGYTIYFTDNTTAVVKHGTNGTPGNDAPVIGVKKDDDGVYYWTVTTGGKTDWLTDGGKKLRVTGESVQPLIAIDKDGFWTISFDNGTTFDYILDSDKNPVSAVAGEGGAGSLFSSVTYDDNNVYFRLTDGSMITVPRRSSFYMLIRQAPEQAPFVYGETQTFQIESVGVEKVVITKPDEWHVAYADNKLTITAPEKTHSDCCEKSGEVSLIYFSANNASSAVSMKVIVGEDYRGETQGDNFTVKITEITDKSVTAVITPKNLSENFYVTSYLADKYDADGEAAFIAEQMGMLNYFISNEYMWPYLEPYLHKGEFTYTGTQLTPGQKLYITVFGVNADYDAKSCSASTSVMTVPFATKTPVVINSQYRIEVSDVSWFGAKYVTAPTDDLPYLHGFVKKSAVDAAASEQEFMEGYVTDLRSYYRKEMEDGLVTWADLTSIGAQTIVAPGMSLQGQALQQNTEYYAFAFGCDEGTVTSPLSKTAFKTGKFAATEQCTFKIETTVERQDVTVVVTPSNKNIDYLWGIAERSSYNEYADKIMFAADWLFFTQMSAADNQLTLADYLVKGDDTYKRTELKAATGYIVYAYGCTPEGVITTEPEIVEFVTKGTIDQAAVLTAGAKAAGRSAGKLILPSRIR